MKAIRREQSQSEFLRAIKSRVVFFGAPRIEREGNNISCLFKVQGGIQRGMIVLPHKSIADSLEAKLRKLYPQ